MLGGIPAAGYFAGARRWLADAQRCSRSADVVLLGWGQALAGRCPALQQVSRCA